MLNFELSKNMGGNPHIFLYQSCKVCVSPVATMLVNDHHGLKLCDEDLGTRTT